jgi:hypothetical protein
MRKFGTLILRMVALLEGIHIATAKQSVGLIGLAL